MFMQLIILWASMANLVAGKNLPTVDAGLFMIYGVETCGRGTGYCLLGIDCTLDDDFVQDDSNGDCHGLERSFSPKATFTCCKLNPARYGDTQTTVPAPVSSSETSSDRIISSTETSTNESDDLGETATTLSPAADLSDVFVDIGNQVFKEVVPPVLAPANEAKYIKSATN